MKIKLALIFIILVFGLFFFFFRRQLCLPVTTINSLLHPFSIQSLASRPFPDQTLTIESKVSANTQVVSYLSDNLKQYALMITPAGTPPVGGWPVVIVNHGHIPPYQYSTTQSYINTSNFFASKGFLVLKPDYRGHDKSEGTVTSLLARSEYAVDVLSLLSTLNSVPNANPSLVFMYGHSMGGDISLQVLEATHKITAATLWAPAVTTYPESITYFIKNRDTTINDLNQFDEDYPNFINNFPITQISPIDHLDLLSTPLNLHHSTTDQSVPYAWGVALDDKLKSMGKTVNFYSYQGDNHDISGHWTQALTRDVDFFNSFK